MATLAKSQAIAPHAKSEQHHEALERLFQRLGQLSSLPAAAQRISQVAESERSNAADLLQVVGQDPALSVRILRTVNSSFFGIPNEVGDLKTAISMLGFVEVRNLALTIYVARLCEDSSKYRSFSREGLWQHMVAVGTIARTIANIYRRVEPEEAYMAGLLHDVGMLLIDQYMHKPFCQAIDLVSEGIETTEAERRILTFDHTDLGAYVARKSNFPERMAVAIQYHHRPSDYRGRERELLDIVAMANYLASRRGLSSLGISNIAAPDARVCSSLGLHKRHLKAILSELDETLKSAQVLADI